MGLVGQYFRFLEAELQEDWEQVNPLSPNSDQQQISPNDIHTLSWDEVMRIYNKMITQEKILWSFIKFS